MPISENKRKLFQDIGLDVVRREVAGGEFKYIPNDDESREEARQWIAEEETKLAREKLEAAELETSRFETTLRWTKAGVIVAIIAAIAAVIAAWPVIKEWIK
jgi:phage terminase Nu1 subunit (DNA packaging protein)